jgi:hypothetical protein
MMQCYQTVRELWPDRILALLSVKHVINVALMTRNSREHQQAGTRQGKEMREAEI